MVRGLGAPGPWGTLCVQTWPESRVGLARPVSVCLQAAVPPMEGWVGSEFWEGGALLTWANIQIIQNFYAVMCKKCEMCNFDVEKLGHPRGWGGTSVNKLGKQCSVRTPNFHQSHFSESSWPDLSVFGGSCRLVLRLD